MLEIVFDGLVASWPRGFEGDNEGWALAGLSGAYLVGAFLFELQVTSPLELIF
jgi:hypothetical protein